MDIEKLTKSQIVLLTLLVSFVTSIATGVVTISLVDQGPATITQSVSRIVRETVMNTVPAALDQSASAVETKTAQPGTQIAPTLSQLLVNANRSVVRLYGGSADSPIFLGLGLVIDAKGTVLADYESFGLQQTAFAATANSSSTPMSVVLRDSTHDFVYLAPVATSSQKFYPASFAESQSQVGDSVIVLAGKDTLRIAPGLVVASDQGALQIIDTNVPTASIIKGSPIMSADGRFAGMSTGSSRALDSSSFIPLSLAVLHASGEQQ